VVILTLFRNPRYYAFIFVYSAYKAVCTRSIKINARELVKRALVSVFLGYGIVTLDLARLLTLFLNSVSVESILSFPEVLVFSFKTRENSLMSIAYRLRIYKKDGEIRFNPTNYGEVVGGVKKAAEVVGVKSMTSGSRYLYHPGVSGFPIEGDGSQSVLQLTKSPIPGMKGFFMERVNGVPSFVNCNTIQLGKNIIPYRGSDVLASHGLKNRFDLEMFYMRVASSRLFELDIRIEGSRGIYEINEVSPAYG